MANNTSISSGNFNANVANGNLITAWIWYNSTSESVSSVTDTKGNTYVRAVGPTTGAGGLAGWRQEIWYAKNVAGGAGLSATATFTSTFSGKKSITVHEYSGVDRVAPLDATAATITSSANASSGVATTRFANELIFGAALFANSGTAGSGFSQRSLIRANVSEDRIVTTVGSQAATFSNSPQDVIAHMAAFKAAGQ